VRDIFAYLDVFFVKGSVAFLFCT